MTWFKPLLVALSTYTRIPLPPSDFREEDMGRAMCFFPVTGVLVGAFFCLWWLLAEALQLGALLRAAGLVLMPLAVTGGIHMDGFMDTADALSSWQPREKKLEILKDVHLGAFAVIRAGMYLLALLGLYSELRPHQLLPLALGFVLSRCLVNLMTLRLPNARGSGMLSSFQQNQDRAALKRATGLFAALALALGLLLSWQAMLGGLLGMALLGLWFHRMALKQFGGITGDLAGFLLQTSELAYAAGLVLLGRLL